MSILNSVNSPQTLRTFDLQSLEQYKDELREFLIDTISKTGGHFSANLGAVELAVALHYVFETPHDKLIWDVGHQAYPHKIITGRKEAFKDLRQWGGISGFPKMDESEYDSFGTGHSSTSISAITGMAAASKLLGKTNKHIAVIGDGALSAGQAFEGLNNLGFLKLPVLIILNDNHMGIDPVSGALNDYLAGLKEGDPNFFTRLGIEYKGPVDGHDLLGLVSVFQELKDIKTPLLLHVKTLKGKGFEPAELEQTRWHATGGFDKINPLENKASVGEKFQDVAGKKLLELAKINPKLVAITPAMISGSSLHFMQEVFPERVFDVGIAEQHAVTFAAGLSISGAKPFCFLYSTFLQRGLDQVIHDVCLQKLPVVFCIDRAGLVGEDGPTHHGVFDLSMLQAIPNNVICAPASLNELEDMMEFAEGFDEVPVFIRYPRGTGKRMLSNNNHPVVLGKSQVLKKGKRIALLSFGTILDKVEEVEAILKQAGFEPTLVNMRFLKPLDTNCLEGLLQDHQLFCTFEDAALIGGLGSTLSQWLHKQKASHSLLSFGIPDEFIPHGKTATLFGQIGLSSEDVAEKIVNWI